MPWCVLLSGAGSADHGVAVWRVEKPGGLCWSWLEIICCARGWQSLLCSQHEAGKYTGSFISGSPSASQGLG